MSGRQNGREINCRGRYLFFRYVEMAIALVADKKPASQKKALLILKRLIKLEPNMAVLLWNRAQAYKNIANFSAAKRDLLASLFIETGHEEKGMILIEIAELARLADDREEEIRWLEKAEKTLPPGTRLYYQVCRERCFLAFENGNFRQAAIKLDRLLELAECDQPEERVRLLLTRALTCKKLDMYSQSYHFLREAEKAARALPDNKVKDFLLAKILFTRGLLTLESYNRSQDIQFLKRSLKHFFKARKFHPDAPYINKNIARLAAILEKKEGRQAPIAEKALRTCLNSRFNDSEIHLMAAKLYQDKRRTFLSRRHHQLANEILHRERFRNKGDSPF